MRRPEWQKESVEEEEWRLEEPKRRSEEKESRYRVEEDQVQKLSQNLELQPQLREQLLSWPNVEPQAGDRSSVAPVDAGVLLDAVVDGDDGSGGADDESGEGDGETGWSGSLPDEADGRGLENSLLVSVGVDWGLGRCIFPASWVLAS